MKGLSILIIITNTHMVGCSYICSLPCFQAFLLPFYYTDVCSLASVEPVWRRDKNHQYTISPHSIVTLSSTQVTRIKK